MKRNVIAICWLTVALACGFALAEGKPDHGPGHGPPKGPPPMQMSESDIDAAIEVLQAMRPEMGEKLAKLREDSPERVAQTLQREFPRIRYFLMLKRIDPQMYELRIQDIKLSARGHQLAGQIKEAKTLAEGEAENAERIEMLTEQLRDTVREHFAIRQQIRERELERLLRRIEQIREKLADQAENQSDLIEQRTTELIEGDSRAEW